MANSNYTIKFTLPVQVKDIDNNTITVEVGDTTLNNVCYLLNLTTNTKYYGTHIADGWYAFTDVPDGNYKLFKNESTPVPKWYGVSDTGRWVGTSDSKVSKTGNETVEGIKTFSSSPVIPDATLSNQPVALGQLAGYAKLGVVQTWTAQQNFSVPIYVPNATAAQHPIPFLQVSNLIQNAINSIVFPQLPYRANVRFIIPGATVTPNRIYRTYSSALGSCVTPTEGNYFDIAVMEKFVGVNHDNLADYVNLVSFLQHYSIVLGGGTIVQKDMLFENLTIFFGAYGFTGSRIYPGFKFKNCIIYSYVNCTFNGGDLTDTFVFNKAGTKSTLAGGVIVTGAKFSQDVDRSVEPDCKGAYDAAVDPDYTMPADPTDPT